MKYKTPARQWKKMAQNARKMDGQHHESSEITCGGRAANGKQLDEIGHCQKLGQRKKVVKAVTENGGAQ